jgi:hypothetical protein
MLPKQYVAMFLISWVSSRPCWTRMIVLLKVLPYDVAMLLITWSTPSEPRNVLDEMLYSARPSSAFTCVAVAWPFLSWRHQRRCQVVAHAWRWWEADVYLIICCGCEGCRCLCRGIGCGELETAWMITKPQARLLLSTSHIRLQFTLYCIVY